MRRPTILLATAASAALAVGLIASPASAGTPSSHDHGGLPSGHFPDHGKSWHHPQKPAKPTPGSPTAKTLARNLVAPLSVAEGPRGVTFVTENFAGKLDAVSANGTRKALYTAKGGAEVGGVSYTHGWVTFTETGETKTVKRIPVDLQGKAIGAARTIADTGAYEKKRNPDQRVTYGFRALPASCLSQIPADSPIPAKYTGIVDSHPYATTTVGGWTLVADAGGNDILAIGRDGKIRTVAVLPAQPATITAKAAASFGLPSCVAGHRYWFEPVPTDVETGPHGKLFVSTLPGGPEDDSLGARGSIYTLSLTGHLNRYATGLLGATDVAVSPSGKVYATQLFGGQISVIRGGHPVTFFSAPAPAAVEWTSRGLLATTNALPPDESAPPSGNLVRIS